MILGLIAVFFITSNFYAMEPIIENKEIELRQIKLAYKPNKTLSLEDEKAHWLFKESAYVQKALKTTMQTQYDKENQTLKIDITHLNQSKKILKKLIKLRNLNHNEWGKTVSAINPHDICSLIDTADFLQIKSLIYALSVTAASNFKTTPYFEEQECEMIETDELDWYLLKDLVNQNLNPTWLEKYKTLPLEAQAIICKNLHAETFSTTIEELNLQKNNVHHLLLAAAYSSRLGLKAEKILEFVKNDPIASHKDQNLERK